ncbi:unnamed protein product [Musa acuminata var. zebrina]
MFPVKTVIFSVCIVAFSLECSTKKTAPRTSPRNISCSTTRKRTNSKRTIGYKRQRNAGKLPCDCIVLVASAAVCRAMTASYVQKWTQESSLQSLSFLRSS